MRPTVEEQLRGIATVLADVVLPQVEDPYAADVLDGALATIGVLAESADAVVPFLRWDSAATSDVLAMVGVATPPPPGEPADETALAEHHDAVRALLEASVPLIRADVAADRAFVQLLEQRGARYPFVARYRGGSDAHTAR